MKKRPLVPVSKTGKVTRSQARRAAEVVKAALVSRPLSPSDEARLRERYLGHFGPPEASHKGKRTTAKKAPAAKRPSQAKKRAAKKSARKRSRAA